MSVPFIDLKAQYKALKADIDKNIQTVLDHGMFILGPEVKQCEEKLAEFVGAKYCVSTASGTDSLIMALLAMDIKPGDEIITTPFSFAATIEPIIMFGGVPVLVDISLEDYNLDPSKIEEAITPKTKAIMPVSLYGQAADLDEMNAIAEKHGLFMVEDAAQSFGAKYKDGKSCGRAKTMAATSFFPAKPLGCYGDGGALFTDDKELYERLMRIRNHGQSSRYYHTEIGINGRMDTLQCAVLMPKLERYPWEVERRNAVAARYTEAFKDVAGIKTPKVKSDRESVWAQYTLMLDNRAEVQKRLQEMNIPTSVHYPTVMSEQPAFKAKLRTHDISNGIKAASEAMSIPMYPDMTEEIQDKIIAAVIKAVQA